MHKFSKTYLGNTDKVYYYLKRNAKRHTIKELVKILKEKYNVEIENKRLAQYCIKMGIKYKYECKNKSHSNKPTANGTIAIKTDGNMFKIKTDNHKWEYLQRKIYEDYYNVTLPDDVYVIFLNKNNRDFNIKNLKAISRRESAIMGRNNLISYDKRYTKLGLLATNLLIKANNIGGNNDKIN